ncbi:hypothetical protein CAOG_06372 [Capsaspora owczarzaki ATCC 30864]|nr:hypothetical protein CAOG_06372 [Capsaspora owczarzaki ATCC 30864]|eukprot:XP_004345121.1 hypothetical protein CAOG_06372 [Capsaspora owczarzaki ATCC 30864]
MVWCTVPDVLVRNSNFSVVGGVQSLARGGYRVLDLLIGMRAMTNKYSDSDIETFVARRRAWHLLRGLKMTAVPFVFVDSEGTEVDLRFAHPHIRSKLSSALHKIATEVESAWNDSRAEFRGMVKQYIAANPSALPSSITLTAFLDHACVNEQNRRLLNAIRTDAKLDALAPGIGSTLHQLVLGSLLATLTQSELSYRLDQLHSTVQADLQKKHPILSQTSWLARAVSAAEAPSRAAIEAEFNPTLLARARQAQLPLFVFLLQRLQSFDPRPIIKQYSSIVTPKYELVSKRKIWNPNNWIITDTARTDRDNNEVDRIDRTEPGQADLNPPELTEAQLDRLILSPELAKERAAQRPFSGTTPSRGVIGPHWNVETSIAYRITSRFPGWRLALIAQRSFVYSFNIFFVAVLGSLISGPFGVRALFERHDFPLGKQIWSDGRERPMVIPNRICVSTLWTRLNRLHAHVHQCRVEYEATMDNGIIGKGFSRPFHILWHRGIVGGLGSVMLLVGQPILTVLNVGLSLAAGVGAPAIALGVALARYLADIVLYDSSTKGSSHRGLPLLQVLFRNLLDGLVKVVVPLIAGLAVLPIAAVFVVLFGAILMVASSIWDTVVFNAVLRHRARVPRSDTFLAVRVKGPGLMLQHFYQADPSQVLLTLRLLLERKQLQAYRTAQEAVLRFPLDRLEQTKRLLFTPLSLTVDSDAPYEKHLKARHQHFRHLMDKMIEQRELDLGLYFHSSGSRRLDAFQAIKHAGSIKLTRADLEQVLTAAEAMVAEFYTTNIMPLLGLDALVRAHELDLNVSESEWRQTDMARLVERGRKVLWTGRSHPDDWDGLSRELLTSIFVAILSPLEDTDVSHRLKPRHITPSRYMNMLVSGDWQDTLETVRVVVDAATPAAPAVAATPEDQCVYLQSMASLMQNFSTNAATAPVVASSQPFLVAQFGTPTLLNSTSQVPSVGHILSGDQLFESRYNAAHVPVHRYWLGLRPDLSEFGVGGVTTNGPVAAPSSDLGSTRLAASGSLATSSETLLR